MDSLSHAFAVILLVSNTIPAFVPAAVAGAVIPDADILAVRYANRHPGAYIFTHGGFTHTVFGSCLLCAVATIPFAAGWQVLSGSGLFLSEPGMTMAVMVFGAMTHICLDLLANPGIPVLYPGTDRKITLGVFPGPPLPLFAWSLVAGIWLLLTVQASAVLFMYQIGFCAYLGIMIAFKGAAATIIPGRTIPTVHPLHWLELENGPSQCTVRRWSLLSGPAEEKVYERFQGICPGDLGAVLATPEARRMYYTSYTVVVSVQKGMVILCDPIRSNGFISYPPWLTRTEIPLYMPPK